MNLKSNVFKFFIFTILLAFLSSCDKEDIQAAEDSVIGSWNVTQIKSHYGYKSLGTITDEGVLGTFKFTENSVEYSFTRNDTLYSDTTTWNFNAEEPSRGFLQSTIYTIDIKDRFVFDVTYENGTINSEKNAQEMTLLRESEDCMNGEISIELRLEK
jgi:hypothetical protein